MDEFLEKIALDKETKSVLAGGGGRLKVVYDLMLAQEAGKWEAAKQSADQLRISESETGEMWWHAMQWARQVSSHEESPPRSRPRPYGSPQRQRTRLRGSEGWRSVPLCKSAATLDLHEERGTA